MTASEDKSSVERSPVVEEIDVGISVVSIFVRSSDVDGTSVDCLVVGLSVVKDVVTNLVEILSGEGFAVETFSVVDLLVDWPSVEMTFV